MPQQQVVTDAPGALPPTPKKRPLPMSLLKTARPKQWVKNILVFAAPVAAGRLFEADAFGQTLLAFAAFTLASVSTYFVNDALDHESDRQHPKKRFRPIAAGDVSLRLAWSVAVAALVGSLALSFLVINMKFGLLLTGYIVMTLAYSTYLKHVAVVDLACVTAGFVLRMIAGGLATDIVISDWFLTVACFSSLFMVAGKRYAEITEMGHGNAGSRAVLRQYTSGFLKTAYTVALAVSVASYCQWAFDRADASGAHIWYQLSAVPWVAALLRYALLLERGQGGAPEDVVASDRVLQIIGVVWIGVFLLGVYDG